MEIPIKLNLPDQENVDPLGQALVNVVVADSGIRLRPGYSDVIDTGSGVAIDGIYDWEEEGYIIVVSGGSVFKLSDSVITSFSNLLLEDGTELLLEDGTGSLLLEAEAAITDVTNDTLQTGARVIFANFRNKLYMANGGKIIELHPSQDVVSHGGTTYTAILNSINIEPGVDAETATYWTATGSGGDAWVATTRYGSGTADYLEDALVPTTVFWIGVADKYLFALEPSTERLHFSVVDEPWNFDADWVSAEFLPDDATCLRVYNGDVWVGGRRSIQSFDNDGSTPWVPSGYGAITSGVLAPYSFMHINGTFYWIDTQRRLVALNGREPVSVNKTLDTYLNTLSQVSDAIADYIVIDGIQYYILQFPSEDKTIALNVDSNAWAEWLYMPTGFEYKWAANCMTYVPTWDLVMMGDRADGFVKSIDSSCQQDDGVDIGGTIRSPRIQTMGTTVVGSLAVGFTKVSKTISSGSSSITVKWRSDGKDWTTPRTITLDDSKTDFVKYIRRCGSYRYNRQYEFDLTNIWPYAIQKVEQL